MTFKFLKFPLIAATVLLASCSSEEDIPAIPNTPSENAIAFSTYVGNNQSRASVMTLDELKQSKKGFGVFASYTQNQSWADGQQLPNFMYNQHVTFYRNAWTYSPVKYWPASNAENISFFAYAPYFADSETDVEPTTTSILGLPSKSVNGDPIIKLQVGSNVKDQFDLVYASGLDVTNSVGTVPLQFKHALARVGFTVTGWESDVSSGTFDANTTVYINAISLSTNRLGASLNMRTGEWFNSIALRSHVFILTSENMQHNAIKCGEVQGRPLNTDDGYMMIIPDAELYDGMSHSYCLLVDYTVETVDPSLASGKVVTRNKVYQLITPNFEQGKAYTINIHLGMGGSNPGEFEPEPDDPMPVDPNPDDPTIPTPPTSGGHIKFSATMTDWANPGTTVTVNL